MEIKNRIRKEFFFPILELTFTQKPPLLLRAGKPKFGSCLWFEAMSLLDLSPVRYRLAPSFSLLPRGALSFWGRRGGGAV